MPNLIDERRQAIAGVVPPQQREAVIRVSWPSNASYAVGTPGRLLIQSYVLAPLGWFLMLPFYFMKVLPIVGKRYTLTNRRVMIQRGWSRKPKGEVALTDIDDVRIVRDSNSQFYRSGTVQILTKGQVRLVLAGVKEPEVFCHAVRNACMAWVPGKAKQWLQFVPAKAPDGK